MTTGSRVHFELEFSRSERAGDPFDFRFMPQTYHLRTPGGGAEAAEFPWTSELLEDLALSRAPGKERESSQRIGQALRKFLLASSVWNKLESDIIHALHNEAQVFVTIRSSAAELYSLPWEFAILKSTGQYVGAIPNLLIRYEWPGTTTFPDRIAPRKRRGRVLFAWSAAGGAVPAGEHLTALSDALKAHQGAFDSERDVIGHASCGSITRALDAASRVGPPVDAIHILCHGAEIGGAYGLVLDDDDHPGNRVVVDASRVQQIIAPYTGMVRMITIAACDSGNSGALGNHLGSVAQMIHRAGLRLTIASRFPLSTPGSTRFTSKFFTALGEHATAESAFVAARGVLLSDPNQQDWASIQFLARVADGGASLPLKLVRRRRRTKPLLVFLAVVVLMAASWNVLSRNLENSAFRDALICQAGLTSTKAPCPEALARADAMSMGGYDPEYDPSDHQSGERTHCFHVADKPSLSEGRASYYRRIIDDGYANLRSNNCSGTLFRLLDESADAPLVMARPTVRKLPLLKAVRHRLALQGVPAILVATRECYWKHKDVTNARPRLFQCAVDALVHVGELAGLATTSEDAERSIMQHPEWWLLFDAIDDPLDDVALEQYLVEYTMLRSQRQGRVLASVRPENMVRFLVQHGKTDAVRKATDHLVPFFFVGLTHAGLEKVRERSTHRAQLDWLASLSVCPSPEAKTLADDILSRPRLLESEFLQELAIDDVDVCSNPGISSVLNWMYRASVNQSSYSRAGSGGLGADLDLVVRKVVEKLSMETPAEIDSAWLRKQFETKSEVQLIDLERALLDSGVLSARVNGEFKVHNAFLFPRVEAQTSPSPATLALHLGEPTEPTARTPELQVQPAPSNKSSSTEPLVVDTPKKLGASQTENNTEDMTRKRRGLCEDSVLKKQFPILNDEAYSIPCALKKGKYRARIDAPQETICVSEACVKNVKWDLKFDFMLCPEYDCKKSCREIKSIPAERRDDLDTLYLSANYATEKIEDVYLCFINHSGRKLYLKKGFLMYMETVK